MSLSVTSNPDKLVNTVQSNVNAAITQLPYNFKREDDTSITQTRVTALKQMLITIADETLYAVGDACYYDVVSASFTGNRVATIESIAPNTLQFFADDTLPEYATEPSTGYLNIVSGTRGDYAVELKVEDTFDGSLLNATLIYIPDQAGFLFVDLGPVVVSWMEQKAVNTMNYRVQYRETYTGFDPVYTNDAIIQAVLGERSIGLVGGSNMIRYVLRGDVLYNLDAFVGVGGGNQAQFRIEVAEGDVSAQILVGSEVELAGVSLIYDGLHIITSVIFQTGQTYFTIDSLSGNTDILVQSNVMNAQTFTSGKLANDWDSITILPSGSWDGSKFTASSDLNNVDILFDASAAGCSSATGFADNRIEIRKNGVTVLGSHTVSGGPATDFFTIAANGQSLLSGDTISVYMVVPTFDAGNFVIINANCDFSIQRVDAVTAGTAEFASDLSAFLTFFKVSRFWPSFTSSISYIMDSNYTTRTGKSETNMQIEEVDINGVALKSYSIPEANISARIIEVNFTDVLDLFEATKALHIQLQAAVPPPLFLVIPILQFNRMDICKNPIMVTWVNSLGASEYYLFEISQEVLLNATEGLVYQQSRNQDVENVHRQKIRLSSDETLKIVCRAEKLTQDDVIALHELKTSEKVEVYLNKDGSKRVGVIVSEGFATNYDTDDPLNEFTVVLEFPEDYKFFDVKEY
jgi:hypothetical protein